MMIHAPRTGNSFALGDRALTLAARSDRLAMKIPGVPTSGVASIVAAAPAGQTAVRGGALTEGL
jgi:hypothetical protein